MALPSTGELSLSAIQTEFGGSNPIAISEYYSAAANVPASGTIQFAHFYGQSAGYTFNATISANTQNYDVRAAAVSAGWNQTLKLIANITINSGVWVGSSSTAGIALNSNSSGTFPTGSTISITNNGYIVGCGGNGGAGGGATAGAGQSVTNGTAGGAGGTALKTRITTTINNLNGTVAGGGGGGGGGASAAYSNGSTGNALEGGGGGGGRGYSAGSGAAAGTRTDTVTDLYSYYASGAAGTNATTASQGYGGSYATCGVYVLTPSGWKSTFQLRARGGSGGNGGDWGSSAGLAGTASDVAAETFTLSTRGSAGGAGKYIDGSAYATWTNAGTRLGTTS